MKIFTYIAIVDKNNVDTESSDVCMSLVVLQNRIVHGNSSLFIKSIEIFENQVKKYVGK